jgi:cell division protein FtsB
MIKIKPNPRPMTSGELHKPSNFFYRLVSSQRFLAIIGLVFLLIIIIPLAKTFSQRRLIEKEIEDVKQEISDYESKNQELQEIITYLESDQSLEEQARLNLNLKKPGETVIVVEEDKNLKKEFNLSENSQATSHFSKWWQYFFD